MAHALTNTAAVNGLGLIDRARTAIAQYRSYRQTLTELGALSNRELADLGGRVADQGARQAEVAPPSSRAQQQVELEPAVEGCPLAHLHQLEHALPLERAAR